MSASLTRKTLKIPVNRTRGGLLLVPSVPTLFAVISLVQSLLGVDAMASIVVRGLDESVKARLAARAKKRGRSMEAEVREILTRAATQPNIGLALLCAGQSVGGVEELPVPERSDRARAVEFS